MSLQAHQSLNLLFLLLVASFTAYVHLSWMDMLLILSFTLLIEHLFLYFNPSRNFYFSYASLSTAVGVMVLVYASSLWIYFVIIALGLAQKHFFILATKHFFNPSNFALIMALLLFYDDAHFITGQFGDEVLFSMLVFVLALSILVRIGRLAIPFLFIFFYLGLQYFCLVLYDPTVLFEFVYQRFYSVTFMLFVYFMLTDPAVTPLDLKAQVLFVFLVVFVATLLDRFYGFRVQHLFMSLFLVSFMMNFSPLKKISLRELKYGMIILVLIIAGLIFIESQAPYYFEMNG